MFILNKAIIALGFSFVEIRGIAKQTLN